MKLTGLSMLLVSFVLLFAFSVQAQDEKSAKTGKDKRSEIKSKNKKSDESDREYLVGARGGCYYLNSSGKKIYVDKENCRGLTASTTETKSTALESNTEVKTTDVKSTKVKSTETTSAPERDVKTTDSKTTIADPKVEKPEAAKTDKKTNSDGRTYIKGSRGGCYYLSESGKKVYVKDKSLCEN